MCNNIDVSRPDDLATLVLKQREEDIKNVQRVHNNYISKEEYWKRRYITIQIEYLFEIMRYGWAQIGFNVGDSFSARAGIKFNDLIRKYSPVINN